MDRYDIIERIDREHRNRRRLLPWSSFRCIPHRQDVADVLIRMRDALNEMGVTELYLFGSVARGDADWDSDVDMAAKTSHPHPGMLDSMAVAVKVEDILMRPVDVVSLPFKPPLAGSGIEDELVRVF